MLQAARAARRQSALASAARYAQQALDRTPAALATTAQLYSALALDRTDSTRDGVAQSLLRKRAQRAQERVIEQADAVRVLLADSVLFVSAKNAAKVHAILAKHSQVQLK